MSVRPSVTYMEVIVKLLFGPIASSFTCLIPSAAVPNSKGTLSLGEGQKYWGNGKILLISTKIAVCRWFGLTPVNDR